MMKSAVQDHTNLFRVDGAFIVNEDEEGYNAALSRRKNHEQQAKTVERVDTLEAKMDLILRMLADIQSKG